MARTRSFAMLSLLPMCFGCASISGASDLDVVEDAGPDGSGASGGTGGGGSGGSAGAAGSAGASGAAGTSGSTHIDYAQGTWQLANISNSAGTITHDGRLVFVGNTPIVAWAEPEFGSTSDQDIWAGPIGSVQEITDGTIQFAFPSLALSGGQALLGWSSGKDGDQDVYVAMGPNFASHTNISTKGDNPTEHTDINPWVGSGGGTNAVAYISGAPLATELWIATWTSSVTAATLQAVITDKGSCDDPNLRIDGSGNLHVLVVCGGKTHYASNATGSWEVSDMSGGSTGNMMAQLVFAPDGQTMIGAWVTGARELLFIQRTLTTPWSAPAPVAANVIGATVGIDGSGRILAAFSRRDTDNNDNVFFSWFEGGSWAPDVDITDDADSNDEHGPSAMTIDPSGLPVFLYERNEPNSDPLNVDVWQAKFIPAR